MPLYTELTDTELDQITGGCRLSAFNDSTGFAADVASADGVSPDGWYNVILVFPGKE